MKIIIGVILGTIITYAWLMTIGKIHITETQTLTNIVVSIETQIVEQARWVDIYRTNEVWKTNIVEKLAQAVPVTSVAPVVQKTIEQPKIIQPVVVRPTTTKPIIETPTGLRKARPAGKVTIGTPAKQDMRPKVRQDMDGNIK